MGISLDYLFNASVMGAEVAHVTMSGSLNGQDRSGDLCLETDLDLLWGPVLRTLLSNPTLKGGGGLWHHPGNSKGTGFSFMLGAEFGQDLQFGIASASLMVGLESGMFTNLNSNSMVGGQCNTPYLTGSFKLFGFTWDIKPSANITGFPKIYTDTDGKVHPGFGLIGKACKNPEQEEQDTKEELTEEEKAQAENDCNSVYDYIGDDYNEIGFGNFPEKSEDKPWGGVPKAATDTCNPYSNCAHH